MWNFLEGQLNFAASLLSLGSLVIAVRSDVVSYTGIPLQVISSHHHTALLGQPPRPIEDRFCLSTTVRRVGVS